MKYIPVKIRQASPAGGDVQNGKYNKMTMCILINKEVQERNKPANSL